ncbi:response regulator [Herminiimonas contaminans]|uniref:Response regulator transcription factor n=1 Tax=Herminiimonas contaminans TaxID=1111140 RepID=A0ABS0ENA0_9BURK|nr:response regulator transcription factor [Herminiimonas contaminans]MBF8176333.1 response regulator transcription factor [Herminiimonas contaminans]
MIQILIADDHAIIRDGLKQIISFVSNMAVAGEASNGEEVLQKIRMLKVDVLVLDMSMPGKSGIALIQQINAIKPDLPILVLSMHQESQYAVQAMRAGASGYITKNTASSQLIEGIRKVAEGGTFVSPEISAKLIKQLHKPETDLPHTKLTAREFQIFSMLVEGHSVNDIAKILSLSNKTISTHKAAVLQKMEASTTASLVYYALKHGLINEGYD